MIRTDTALDQDRRTEGNCVCMYTVQCRVIVDNKCEFQHCESKTRKYKQANISEVRQDDFRSPTQVQHTIRKTRSHLAGCESFKTRQFCQPILAQPI